MGPTVRMAGTSCSRAWVLAAAVAVLAASQATGIKTVYVVWSNHLDVGYTLNVNGSSAGAVVNEYFHRHFPNAIATAETMREKNLTPYSWMTQSWLIDFYLNCDETKLNILGPDHASDVVCPNASAVAEVEAAVRRGDITYHAFPFNSEPEMYTAELFDAALNITFRLDEHFGHAKRKTLSQRDVPGLTRAAIPLLARRGVRAVSVGENSQCAPLAVPPIFVWRDEATGSEVLALFHALGYGLGQKTPSSSSSSSRGGGRAIACNCSGLRECGCSNDPATLVYVDTNGDVVGKAGLDPHDDGPAMYVDAQGKVHVNRYEHCVEVEAADVAVCYAWKVDNTGPHTWVEAELLMDVLKEVFPDAERFASSDAFDDFVEAVLPHMDTLPAVTAELGDTWMMGANADPLKVALYRAAAREYGACMQRGGDAACVGEGSEATTALRTFERLLLTVGEHTWGWNGGDVRRRCWSNDELARCLRQDTDFSTSVLTWLEQRSFISNAVAALPRGSPLASAIAAAHADITAAAAEDFDAEGFVDTAPRAVRCGSAGDSLLLSFGQDGSVTEIAQLAPELAGKDPLYGPFFRLVYDNLDHEDFQSYAHDYIAGPSVLDPSIVAENLVKPNMRLPSLSANATMTRLRANRRSGDVLVDFAFPAAPHEQRGAPARAQALLQCVGGRVQYTLRTHNKTRTHAPETIWLSHRPQGTRSVSLDKLGQPVDPASADLGCDGHRHTCGVHLHGVGDGGVVVTVNGSAFAPTVRLTSVDSALVSVGVVNALPTPLTKPDVTGGVHFAIVGNIWNTNYPFWYPFVESDTSSQFRFALDTRQP